MDYPKRGAAEEVRDLEYNEKRTSETEPPTNLRDVEYAIFSSYPRVSVPKPLLHLEESALRVEIEKCLEEVKLESSPGIPFASLELTNENLLYNYGSYVLDCVIARIRRIATIPLSEIKNMTAVEVYLADLYDPFRLFVKQDLMSLEKLARASRLIMVASLTDQLIERLLGARQNQKEIRKWSECPSKPGMGFTDAHAAQFHESVPQEGELNSSDMSGWDWTVQSWMFDSDARRRIFLSNSAGTPFGDLIEKVAVLSSRNLLITSDGTVFSQTFRGIMKSGRYWTSSTNSYIRNLVEHLLGATWSVSMGDDNCSAPALPKEEYAHKARLLGVVVKQHYHTTRDNLEFCSHVWSPHGAIPVNHLKSFGALLNSQMDPQRIRQFFSLNRLVDERLLRWYRTMLEVYAQPELQQALVEGFVFDV